VASVGRRQRLHTCMTFQDPLVVLSPHFPQLTAANSRPTIPYDEGYNCIAWAVEDTDRWWWPDPQRQQFWPARVPRQVTLAAFVQAYGLLGYARCAYASIEAAKQKITIYTSGHGKPTHAARQLRDGWWASKLGEQIDIEHELSARAGPEYGTVAIVLSRAMRP